MNIISAIANGRCDALVDALRTEVGGTLVEQILEAEAADFLWDSRVRERYLGQDINVISDGESMSEDISRVAVLSLLDGRWHAAICLVDGEGAAVGLVWKLHFASGDEAEFAFLHAK